MIGIGGADTSINRPNYEYYRCIGTAPNTIPVALIKENFRPLFGCGIWILFVFLGSCKRHLWHSAIDYTQIVTCSRGHFWTLEGEPHQMELYCKVGRNMLRTVYCFFGCCVLMTEVNDVLFECVLGYSGACTSMSSPSFETGMYVSVLLIIAWNSKQIKLFTNVLWVRM